MMEIPQSHGLAERLVQALQVCNIYEPQFLVGSKDDISKVQGTKVDSFGVKLCDEYAQASPEVVIII